MPRFRLFFLFLAWFPFRHETDHTTGTVGWCCQQAHSQIQTSNTVLVQVNLLNTLIKKQRHEILHHHHIFSSKICLKGVI